MAYHSTAGYFRTFIDDCEEKRLQSDANEFYLPDNLATINVWEFIKLRNRVSAAFYNELYEQIGDIVIPSSSIPQIHMWPFLAETHLKYGSPYDIGELVFKKNYIISENVQNRLRMNSS